MGDEERTGTPPESTGGSQVESHEGERFQKKPKKDKKKETRDAGIAKPAADAEAERESEVGGESAGESQSEIQPEPAETKTEAEPAITVEAKSQAREAGVVAKPPASAEPVTGGRSQSQRMRFRRRR